MDPASTLCAMYLAAASFSGALSFDDMKGIRGIEIATRIAPLDLATNTSEIVAMTSEKGVLVANESAFVPLEIDGLAKMLNSPNRSHRWVLTGKGRSEAEHQCVPDKSVPTS